MWAYLEIALVSAGIVAIGRAVLLNARLIRSLPVGAVRMHWYAMTALEAAFVVGYGTYLLAPGDFGRGSSPTIVPVVFFLGGIFVWANARLSLETAASVRNIAMLQVEAATDPLTGLYNRRFLDQSLGAEIARAKRSGAELAVMMVDVDHFKMVNDRFGHQTGDIVLVRMGALLRETVRSSDLVARYGGEEFVIVAPEAGGVETTQLAERVRLAVAAHDFALPTAISSPEPFNITVSIGTSAFGKELGTAQALLQAADTNLYQAKRQGRNRVVPPSSAGRKSGTAA